MTELTRDEREEIADMYPQAVAAKLREWETRCLKAEAEITTLKAENEAMIFELLRIGDRAVVYWDDATVGEVARAGAVPTQTYIEMRRAELAQWEVMKAEIDKLKAEREEFKPDEPPGDSAGCVPCYTCGGWKPPKRPCDCQLKPGGYFRGN